MAAPMPGKVHVEIEASDSEQEKDFEQSSSSDEEKDGDSSDDVEDEPIESPTGGKTGLADVLAKILHKNVPSHKQVILSKGKTDKEIRKRKLEREAEEDTEKKSAKVESSEYVSKIAREERVKLWENMCRSKPDPLDRDKERQLQKIATRGVVQLFNAVRKQQKVLEEEIQQVGSSERKKDKIMEGMTKDKFLTILKGTSKTNVKSEKPEIGDEKTGIKSKDIDNDSEDDSKNSGKTWNILKEDYMMGAKMKDWDKEESDDDDEDDDSGPDDPDLSDSD